MEVKVGPLYKVVVTEYESGWGQRCDPDDTKFFTTLEEAKAYRARWEEQGSYEIFWRGDITKIG
jgi:hypothetical protein